MLLAKDDGYAVFDGQQRLSSAKLFIKGERAPEWKVTPAQRRAGTQGTFALEGLPILKDLEGKDAQEILGLLVRGGGANSVMDQSRPHVQAAVSQSV